MIAIGWYALWSCFIPLIALAPNLWFDAFEIPVVLSFLPDDWHAVVAARFADMETGKFLFFIVIMCLKGSAIGALAALPAAMAADVIDLDTLETGEKRAGAYFSIWSMTRKASYAVGITLGTGTAVLVGFDSLTDPILAPNTPSALLWLACLYSVIPAVFKFVAMPLLWRYPLTEARLTEIQAEIQNTRASSTPNSPSSA
jgi:Na+/melibiose symporter-like transporter